MLKINEIYSMGTIKEYIDNLSKTDEDKKELDTSKVDIEIRKGFSKPLEVKGIKKAIPYCKTSIELEKFKMKFEYINGGLRVLTSVREGDVPAITTNKKEEALEKMAEDLGFKIRIFGYDTIIYAPTGEWLIEEIYEGWLRVLHKNTRINKNYHAHGEHFDYNYVFENVIATHDHSLKYEVAS